MIWEELSPETKELLRQALQSLEERKNGDIETWAKNLAEDVSQLTD